jgi:hypothetical protein
MNFQEESSWIQIRSCLYSRLSFQLDIELKRWCIEQVKDT